MTKAIRPSGSGDTQGRAGRHPSDVDLVDIKVVDGLHRRDGLMGSKMHYFSDDLMAEVIRYLDIKELCKFAETCRAVQRNRAFQGMPSPLSLLSPLIALVITTCFKIILEAWERVARDKDLVFRGASHPRTVCLDSLKC